MDPFPVWEAADRGLIRADRKPVKHWLDRCKGSIFVFVLVIMFKKWSICNPFQSYNIYYTHIKLIISYCILQYCIGLYKRQYIKILTTFGFVSNNPGESEGPIWGKGQDIAHAQKCHLITLSKQYI